jgi:predicted GNAT superfamily acetyltransferase
MSPRREALIVSLGDQTGAGNLAAIRVRLGAPDNPLLFPPHFLESALPKIGGRTLAVTRDGETAAYAFLFPRGPRGYTVRWHPLAALDPGEALPLLARHLPDADLTLYDPRAPQPYARTEIFTDAHGFRYGRPDEAEARAARDLQRAIWQPASDDGLYPSDLYSAAFGAATALVARAGAEVAGFLFGFYKLGGPPLPRAWERDEGLRIESQVAGVDPRHQGKGVGFHLKRLQGEQARREGIDLVNWTVDPLQLHNARLNFKRLRAVSFRFLPGHYALRSDQNRTRASRLEITWRMPQAGAPGETLDLERMPEVAIANDGPRALPFDREAARVAIEIPRDWTALQKQDLSAAERWRDATDEILAGLLGPEEGRFTIVDVGTKGGRPYLVARRTAGEDDAAEP